MNYKYLDKINFPSDLREFNPLWFKDFFKEN